MQDRAHGRLGEEREVGVPDPAEREALTFRRFPHDRDHLGVLGDRLDEGHRARRTEAAAECDLLRRGERLPACEHDTVVEDRAPDLGDDGVGDITGEIDAADDGAARPGPLLDADVPVRRALGRRRDRHQRHLRHGHAADPTARSAPIHGGRG
jgi:hypothetical protein